MSLRDILAVVTSPEADAHALAYAEKLASAADAHLSGLVVNWIPALPTVLEGWIVDARWGEIVEESRIRLETSRKALEQRLLASVGRSTAGSLLIEQDAAQSILALHARHKDIAVTPRPFKSGDAASRSTVIEGLLFGSGRPVIVVPPEWTDPPSFKTVLVCWDSGREAARALADAMPFIEQAERVVVVTVDAKPKAAGHGELPGADIATHLSRHAKKVELRNVDSMSRREAKTILDEAMATNAGLIVMGGYGRPRLREYIFGGVTRDMLHSSPVPILMSH